MLVSNTAWFCRRRYSLCVTRVNRSHLVHVISFKSGALHLGGLDVCEPSQRRVTWCGLWVIENGRCGRTGRFGPRSSLRQPFGKWQSPDTFSLPRSLFLFAAAHAAVESGPESLPSFLAAPIFLFLLTPPLLGYCYCSGLFSAAPSGSACWMYFSKVVRVAPQNRQGRTRVVLNWSRGAALTDHLEVKGQFIQPQELVLASTQVYRENGCQAF